MNSTVSDGIISLGKLNSKLN